MSRHVFRSATGIGAALLLAVPALAQGPAKGAPKRLEATTSSMAAKAALAEALDEVENIGGGSRHDTKLKAVIAADPQFALGRAYYAGWTSTLTDDERDREMNQAIRDAAGATTAELLIVTALRESRAGNNATARDLTDIVLTLAPDDPHVHWFRQLIANNQEAVRIGRSVTQKFPEYAPSWNILAYALDTAGEKEEALKAVQKYVALAPNHPNSHDSYAEILALQKRYDESDAHYRRALVLDPAWEIAYEGLAENAFARGNIAGARAQLELSLKAAPTPQRRVAVLRQIAVTYVFDNKIKQANEQLNTAIKTAEAASLQGSVQTDHRNLALIAAAQGQRKEALEHYKAGIPAEPGPFIPMSDAILHGLLGNAAEVAGAKAAAEKNAAATPDNDALQQAMHLTQLIDAVVNKNVTAARTHQGALNTPVFKAVGGAFMVKPLARAGDKAASQAAQADVQAYQELSLNAALARLIAKR